MSRLVVIALGVALLAVPVVSSTALAADPTCDGRPATIVGTGASDLIRGTDGRDVIVGRGGHDTILGRDGNDIICAGPGQDTVKGGDGRDRIFGQGGDDRLRGGAGRDAIDGGAGTDACRGDADGATLVACEPADLVVQLFAPSSVLAGATIHLEAEVRNQGALRSTPYTLVLVETRSNVSCTTELSVNVPQLALKAGEFATRAWVHGGCAILAGGDPHVDFVATIEQPGTDADPGNDSATVRVDILQPET